MKNYEVKNTDPAKASVIDVDDKSRIVSVAMSEMGSLDLDNDVIDPGAYNKTIKERGPAGAQLIWHLTDHSPSLKSAVGKPSEIAVQGGKLVYRTPILKTQWGDDVLEMYNAGTINQHSVGFRTIKSEPVDAGKPGEHRLIKEILLYEGSAVLWGANPNTPTLSVGKSATKEDIEKDFFAIIKEINNLAKLFKSGHLSDETFELVEITLIQKTDRLQQLYQAIATTQPAGNAVEPENGKGLLDVLQTFNNSLILQNGLQTGIGATA